MPKQNPAITFAVKNDKGDTTSAVLTVTYITIHSQKLPRAVVRITGDPKRIFGTQAATVQQTVSKLLENLGSEHLWYMSAEDKCHVLKQARLVYGSSNTIFHWQPALEGSQPNSEPDLEGSQPSPACTPAVRIIHQNRTGD